MSAISQIGIQILNALPARDHLSQLVDGRGRILLGDLFCFGLMIRLAGILGVPVVYSDL